MKDPQERGPLSTWLYESRVLLNLSPEGAVALVGRYSASTIRKAESDNDDVSRPLWRALTTLYVRLAGERGIALPPMPTHGWRGDIEAGTPAGQLGVPADLSALYDRLDRQADAITMLAGAVWALVQAQGPGEAQALGEAAMDEMLAAAERTLSRRPPADPSTSDEPRTSRPRNGSTPAVPSGRRDP